MGKKSQLWGWILFLSALNEGTATIKDFCNRSIIWRERYRKEELQRCTSTDCVCVSWWLSGNMRKTIWIYFFCHCHGTALLSETSKWMNCWILAHSSVISCLWCKQAEREHKDCVSGSIQQCEFTLWCFLQLWQERFLPTGGQWCVVAESLPAISANASLWNSKKQKAVGPVGLWVKKSCLY